MTVGEKIKAARESKGLSYSQLAEKSGLKKSTLQRYETGATRKIPIEVIGVLESCLGLERGSLMGWNVGNVPDNEQLPQYDNIFPIETKKFPLLGSIACGEPIWANEDRESYIEAGAHIRADFCLRAQGDSMINARIMDGDIVFIRKQPMVDDGEIAAVIIDDEATLKRVYYDKEQQELTLVSENSKYKPFNYRGEELDHIRILGKAVAFQSDVI